MRRQFAHRLAVLMALLLPALASCAAIPSVVDRAGDTYEIRLERKSKFSSKGSTGNSYDVWTLTERVVALRDGGAELEFDLPADTSAEDRTREWQFPARVFRPTQGQLVLLNGLEAEQRLRSWLGEKMSTLCGRWFFTWTAQKIDCDPQSVLQALEPYLRPTDLRDGASYRGARALEATSLKMEKRSSSASIFVARSEIDPEAVRRESAESDVAIAEMMGKPPLTFEAALQARAAERISGTIVTKFETDLSGRARRRTRVTEIEIAGPDEGLERRTTTETTTWRLISRLVPSD